LVKLAWGLKRTCQNCLSRFYDLQRSPIVCPKCGSVYETVVTSRKGRKAAIIEDEPLKNHDFIDIEETIEEVDVDLEEDLVSTDEDLEHDLDDVDVVADDPNNNHR
jgi:uncharacterized protein (TIGR02300 family)